MESILLIVLLGIGSGACFFRKTDSAAMRYYTSRSRRYEETPCYVSYEDMEMAVDHIDQHNTDSWKMRYMKNIVFSKPESAMIIYVGGNGPIVDDFLLRGITLDMAQKFNASLFATEHRYYGGSNTHEDLKYLNSLQAIGDLNMFIKKIKEDPHFKDSKVVLLGSGYGGSLAVWTKVMYPYQVDAVVASGAPLIAQVEFKEFLKQVAKNYLAYTSDECNQCIQIVHAFCVESMEEATYDALKTQMGVCKDVDMSRRNNQQLLFLSLHAYFMDGAEVGISEMKKDCEAFVAYHANLLETNKTKRHIPNLVPFYNTDSFCYVPEEECMDYDYKKFIKNMNKPEYKDTKTWLYQCCMEFGFFATTRSFKSQFEDTLALDFYFKMCTSLFGSLFEEDKLYDTVSEVNERYGGLSPPVENVNFVHGELDPWKVLGMPLTANDVQKVVITVIPKESHSKDLYPKSSEDQPDLLEARENIIKFLGDILSPIEENMDVNT